MNLMFTTKNCKISNDENFDISAGIVFVHYVTVSFDIEKKLKITGRPPCC